MGCRGAAEEGLMGAGLVGGAWAPTPAPGQGSSLLSCPAGAPAGSLLCAAQSRRVRTKSETPVAQPSPAAEQVGAVPPLPVYPFSGPRLGVAAPLPQSPRSVPSPPLDSGEPIFSASPS